MSTRRLHLIEGRCAPESIEVVGELLLGRQEACALRLFDETTSRRHARIVAEDDTVTLEDLASSNGTLLNGEPVTRAARLFDGDVIRIGDTSLRYLAAGGDRVTRIDGEEDDDVRAALDPDAADPARDVADAAAVRRLRLVCSSAVASADASDATEVVTDLLALLVEAFDPGRAVICLTAPGGDLEVAAAHPARATPPASRTLRRRVLEGGEAVLVSDAHDPADAEGGQSMVRSRYRSMLAAPLKVAEGVLGFVSVEAEAPDAYAESDLRALAATARQTALALRNLRALLGARAEVRRLRAGAASDEAPAFLGEHESITRLRTLIEKAAGADAPVLITGETGTGKEVVARHLHAASARARRPFVALNCAALVEGLLESEFFGHEKGAFTGATEQREGRIAQAADGTLFLDEVGELPATVQAKLLRVLSEGTFHRVGGKDVLPMRCRILAATHRNLKKLVKEGAFREDLYYRLQVLELHVAPLRERGGDVILLAEAALERLAGNMSRRVPRLAQDARAVLSAYPWPGNVRELLNVLERALVLLDGDTITSADLPQEVRGRHLLDDEAAAPPAEVMTIREAEKRAVRAALAHTEGKKGTAAALLGISWPTLNRKIREYGLD